MYNVRLSLDEDKEQVIAIFNHYIENSMAAYPQKALPVQAWDFLRNKCIHGTIFVAEDAEAKVVGFAMLKSFMDLDTFSHTADVGYFVHPNHVGRGLGKLFLAKLEEAALNFGIKILVANVSSLNPESIAFHEHTGFVKCGELPMVGKKHGELFNIIWYYKDIS